MENEAEKKEATADKQVPEEHNTEVQNPKQSTDQPSTEEPSPSNPPQPEKEYNPKFIDYQTYLSYSPNNRWNVDIIGNISL